VKNVTITKVGVGSLGKLLGAANAIISLIIGIIAAVVSTISVIANNNYSVLQDVFVALGIVFGYVLVLPLVAFAIGWLYGAIIALVWNVFLGASQGLDIEITDRK
jgi:cell division protein FtsX